MRFRVILVLLGALLVAATYTVPLWLPLITNTVDPDTLEADVLLSSLTADQIAAFQSLPQEHQAAYRAVAEQDPGRAAAMVRAALTPGIPSPEDEQEPPALSNPITLGTGLFQRVDVIRWAQGDVTIYQQADGSRLMRFENFSVIPAPDMRVLLSPSADPLVVNVERLPLPGTTPTPDPNVDDPLGTGAEPAATEGEALDLGPLIGNFGGQNYPLSASEELSQYRFVVLYSPSLDLVYGYAPLFVRG